MEGNEAPGLRVAAVFSDGCVLQRRKNICVFGTIAPERGVVPEGRAVAVTLRDSAGAVLAENAAALYPAAARAPEGEAGSGARELPWRVYLTPQEAGEGLSLTVSCGTYTRVFTGVAVGEVWLAGGQSNMELELAACAEGPVELAAQADPHVRYYYTPKNASFGEKFDADERTSHWMRWGDEGSGTWSAVGYFFAKRLAAELGVTVGVIGCNWGGTSASAWVPRSRLEGDDGLRSYLSDYDAAVAGRDEEQQAAEYEAYAVQQEQWYRSMLALRAARPGITARELAQQIGPDRWPGPMGCRNPCRPNGLYWHLLRRVCPYTLRGFAYYQGESDDHKPRLYYRLFRALIDQWRGDWGDDTLPFVFVQLPEHREISEPDGRSWCLIRDAQRRVWQTVRHTGMACALGLGQYNDIHPKAKKALAERLAQSALFTAYGLGDAAHAESPVLREALALPGKIVAAIANVAGGLAYRPDPVRLEQYAEMERAQGNAVPPSFTGFEIAGADGAFFPAQAAFGTVRPDGSQDVSLSSGDVPEPRYARYAWYSYGPVTVYGGTGLPLCPFSTGPGEA